MVKALSRSVGLLILEKPLPLFNCHPNRFILTNGKHPRSQPCLFCFGRGETTLSWGATLSWGETTLGWGETALSWGETPPSWGETDLGRNDCNSFSPLALSSSSNKFSAFVLLSACHVMHDPYIVVELSLVFFITKSFHQSQELFSNHFFNFFCFLSTGRFKNYLKLSIL